MALQAVSEPVAKQGGHPRAGGSLLAERPEIEPKPHTILRIMYIMLNGVCCSLKLETAAPAKFPSLPISHPLQTIDSASTTGFLILTDGADLMGAFLK